MKTEITQMNDGRYIVFNGWKKGRRQDIYITYNKSLAHDEYTSRMNGNKPNIKRAN